MVDEKGKEGGGLFHADDCQSAKADHVSVHLLTREDDPEDVMRLQCVECKRITEFYGVELLRRLGSDGPVGDGPDSVMVEESATIEYTRPIDRKFLGVDGEKFRPWLGCYVNPPIIEATGPARSLTPEEVTALKDVPPLVPLRKEDMTSLAHVFGAFTGELDLQQVRMPTPVAEELGYIPSDEERACGVVVFKRRADGSYTSDPRGLVGEGVPGLSKIGTHIYEDGVLVGDVTAVVSGEGRHGLFYVENTAIPPFPGGRYRLARINNSQQLVWVGGWRRKIGSGLPEGIVFEGISDPFDGLVSPVLGPVRITQVLKKADGTETMTVVEHPVFTDETEEDPND